MHLLKVPVTVPLPEKPAVWIERAGKQRFLSHLGQQYHGYQAADLTSLARKRKGGKQVILIEACGRDSASLCDKAVYIRPGTDGALALAMMHVLWREHLEDEDS